MGRKVHGAFDSFAFIENLAKNLWGETGGNYSRSPAFLCQFGGSF
jgi:hypothetical protein